MSSNITKVHATLLGLFSKDYVNYLKEGKEYWFDFSKSCGPVSELSEDVWNLYKVKYPNRVDITSVWFKITITYIRAGIVFYRLSEFDSPNEAYFSAQSIMAQNLIPCVIEKAEVSKYWEQKGLNIEDIGDFSYNTFNGSIEIKVI